jgi:predicted acyltransferase
MASLLFAIATVGVYWAIARAMQARGWFIKV